MQILQWTCSACGYTQSSAHHRNRCMSCRAELGEPEIVGDVAGDAKPLPVRQRGLGDTIYAVTSFLGIPHCGGCQKRREALNKLVPYRSESKEGGSTH